MSPVLIWLLFISLSLVGVVGYDAALKIGSAKADAFIFTTILAGSAFVLHLVLLGFYKLAQPSADMQIGSKMALLGIIAGVSVVMIDFGCFMAIKHGGLLKTNTVWLIGSLILTVLLGGFIFKEGITALKLFGAALGIVAMILMVKE